MGSDRDDAESHDHANGYAPVLANNKLVPELPESLEPLHGAEASGKGILLDMATSPNDIAETKAMIARSARSLPGQDIPVPSELQKTPNDVSMMPTANFSVFSGTRVRGACTMTPATTTINRARTAASVGQTNVVLCTAEGDDYERHLEPLEEDTLECDRKPVPIVSRTFAASSSRATSRW